MECKIFFLFLLSIQFTKSKSPDSTDQSSYGTYKVTRFSLENCEKVMKPRADVTTTFNVFINKAGHRVVDSSLTIAKETGPLMGKTRIYKWTDGKYLKTLTMNQANVCQYAFPIKLLPFTFQIDKNCVAQVVNTVKQ